MKTIKIEKILLDSILVTDYAINRYPKDTFNKLKSVVADISHNNIICESIDAHRARFQYAEGYLVLSHATNTGRIFEFYHEEVVIINE